MQSLSLPFLPESFELVKSRFDRAIAKSVTAGEMLDKALKTLESGVPPQDREHVFDFDSGLRMIADKESLMGLEIIHLSFGLWNHKSGGFLDEEAFIQETSKIMAQLLNRADPFRSFRSNNVVHFFFKV